MNGDRKRERNADGRWKTKEEEFGRQFKITLWIVTVTFGILVLSAMVSFLVVAGLNRLGLLNTTGSFPWLGSLLVFVITSVIVGCLLTWIFSRKILFTFRKFIDAMERLADGDFQTRLDLGDIRMPEIWQMQKSFNHMAQELGSLEMLRADFVNNFSHEFKTPIASVRGFARMLQREDLTKEERKEYLEIIADESERLTRLATNVLNFSRIENQTILTGQTEFNCTEQIRRIIALLEPRWSKKKLRFLLESDELTIYGNMEMLEQVWINLLDNAVKFSPEGGEIELLLRKRPGCMLFTITDQGPGIPVKAREHIFDKFYQADASHTEQGNGLGLTIAKKIIELHKGSVCLKRSDPSGTVLEVMLPL